MGTYLAWRDAGEARVVACAGALCLDLFLVYVIDTPGSMLFVGEDHLSRPGRVKAELGDQALLNVAVRFPMLRVEREGHLFRVRLKGDCGISTPLICARWRKARVLPAYPAFAVPARGRGSACRSA